MKMKEELTQVMIDDYVFGVARSSMMQNMSEMLHNYHPLYSNSIGHVHGITIEEID